MPKVIKTIMELESEIRAAQSRAVIIDFFATWCGPCKILAPKLEEYAKNFPNVVILKVDVDEAEALAEKYAISAMPTFIVIKDGGVAETIIGADTDKIEKAFKKYNTESEHACAE